jgi:ketosteroid isomerase-like protein
MATLLAEDVVWTVAGQSLLARTFTGKADVFGKFFAGLGDAAAQACRSRSRP